MTSTNEEVERALSLLPMQSVKFACGYGSRVLEGAVTSQLDLLLVVNSSELEAWHESNLRRNPTHYSSIFRWQGYKAIRSIGYGFGPKIMYNVSIPLGSLKLPNGEPLYFKYGVIGSTELTDDLETWEHIYVAGRLHKPVLEAAVVRDLQQSRDLVLARVQSAQAQNLRTAARTALLMLPPKFNHMELFSTIAGDVRMAFGENPQKVSNILRHTGNLDKFRSLYHSVIEELQTSHLIQRAGSISDFEQNTSMHDSVIVPSLPQAVRAQCSCSVSSHRAKQPSLTLRDATRRSLHRIIQASSFRQSVKGAVTAGVRKSLAYGMAKVRKNFASRFGRLLRL